ncbi:MAG: PASTA domain-containing protein [Chitinispirillales bacterium]|jgi:cell division protein FtsI/penicillin-binding protein 2|nr:PASTA domain-containing protein [Chitinispirillales bacterium]
MTVGDYLEKISNFLKTDGIIKFSLLFFLFLSIFLITKLWDLQIVNGNEKKVFVKVSAQKKELAYPRRGRILDRNGKEIAISVREKSGDAQWQRNYLYKQYAAPLIGYVKRNYSQMGLAGIEKAFDIYLAGEIGYSEKRRDGNGKLIPIPGGTDQKVKNGADVYLTIDMDIQKITDDIIAETVDFSKASGGMAIVMDPYTGEIYAMSSYPSFDPNGSREKTERNKAISENYEPGSIFKTITFASAIDAGLITPDELVDCGNGIYEIPNERPITDDHKLGVVPYSEAFKLSSNIASAKLVKEKIGSKLFYQYCEKFGIGTTTNIGIPAEEEKGIFNDLINWQPRDAMSMGFGNAVSVTLLQMTIAVSAIANGGYIMKPQIYKKITDRNGNIINDSRGNPKKSKPVIVRRPIKEKTAETMRKLMKDVVNENGTGKAAFVEGMNIGGKTGTSKKVKNGQYLEGHYWASFTGIAPIDKPALVCCVSIDDPEKGKYGGPVAGAAVAKILKNIVASPSVSIGKDIRLYTETANDTVTQVNPTKKYPNFNGLNIKTARKICNDSKIDYDIYGTGNIIIRQIPAADSEIRNYAKVALYTDSFENEIIMPNCVGINIKDAINMLQQRNIEPSYIENGIGRVKRQHPTVGTVLDVNSTCSLFVEKGISEI